MAVLDKYSGSTKAWIAAVAVMLVVLVAWFAGQRAEVATVATAALPEATPDGAAPQAVTPEVAAATPAPEPAVANPEIAVTPEQSAATMPEETVSTEGATTPQVSETAIATPNSATRPAEPAPTFDIVRVDADGNVLVAGRATPMARVSLMLDGAEVGQTDAAADGTFAFLPEISNSDKPRVLSLVATNSAGTATLSEQSVVIAAVEPVALATTMVEPAASPSVTEIKPVPGDANADATIAAEIAALDDVSQPESTTLGAANSDADASAGAGQTTDASPTVVTPGATEAPLGPSAPVVLLATNEGIKVLQGGGATPELLGEIALDSIAYDPEGQVSLSGRGQSDRYVRVYLDNAQIQSLRIPEDGQWTAPLPNVDTGVYTLRIDEVNAAGDVVSRIETPFKREEPAALAALAAPDAPEAGLRLTVVTVQPGNTLWGIASKAYGEGVMYVRVFEANKDRIRDPDLIYPGQVFAVPN